MRLLIIFTISFIVALALASCEKEYFETVPVDTTLEVSFLNDIEPLLVSKCASSGCHDGAVRPNLLKDRCYTSLMDGGYVDTLKPDESILMIRIKKDMPPPSGLPAAELNKVLSWISQGAQEN
jgi:hypothetical protein